MNRKQKGNSRMDMFERGYSDFMNGKVVAFPSDSDYMAGYRTAEANYWYGR